MANLLDEASILLTPTAYNNGSMLAVKPSVILGLELITNGNFLTNLDGWTLSSSTPPIWDNGMMKMTSDGATFSRADQSFVTKIGAEYKFKISKLVNNQTVLVKIGNSISGSNVLNQTISSIDEYTFTITAISTTTYIRLEDGSGTDGGYVSNISVKEDLNGDFTFSRNSAATRVNAQGLVENVQILSSNLVSNGDFSQEGVQLITNGDFSNGINGWQGTDAGSLLSVVLGELKIENGDGSAAGANSSITTEIGKEYRITFVSNKGSAINGIFFGAGTSTNSVNLLNVTDNFDGIHTGTFTATTTTTWFIAKTLSTVNGQFSYIDNISVKEVGQDWTLGTGWSIGDGKAVSDGSQSTISDIEQNITLNQGSTYIVKFDLIRSAGTLYPKVGDTTGTGLTSTQSVSQTIVAGSSNKLELRADANFIGSVANISVIEITDDTNLPRIDYTDGCGSLLLEPQSTNLLSYSEDYSQGYWTKQSGVTATYNTTETLSPDGTYNATKFVGNGTTGVFKASISVSGVVSRSVYLKSVTGTTTAILKEPNTNIPSPIALTITNEWQRFEMIGDNGTSFQGLQIDDITSDGLFMWGAQLEQNSYATSYIPTQGASSTRLKDIATNSGNASLINSEEGVLYAEISALVDPVVFNNWLTITDGTSSNSVGIVFETTGTATARIEVGGVGQAYLNTSVDYSNLIKVAFKYKENDFAWWVNGIKVSTDLSGITFPLNTLNSLQFSYGAGSNNWQGSVKAVAVYKTALTDAQLTLLTTI